MSAVKVLTAGTHLGDEMSRMTEARIVSGGSAASPVQHQPSKTALWAMLAIAPEPDREDAGDEIVRHIVTPLSGQAKNWGAYRFGFSRGAESENSAINLHLRATDDVVQRVWAFAHALGDENIAKLGTLKFTHSPNIVYPPRPGEPVPELVEASFARFGGPEGLKLVDEVSELSADLAMWAVNRFPAVNMRSMLATLLLFDTGHALMRGPRSSLWHDRRSTSWDFYWTTHLHGCAASFGPGAEQARNTMADRLAPRIVPTHRVMAAVASEPSVDIWRRRWTHAIDLYLYRADKQRISRGARQLAMGAGRMLLNRIGISLKEEAVLGIYAHAWSQDIEAQLTGEAHSPQQSKPGRK